MRAASRTAWTSHRSLRSGRPPAAPEDGLSQLPAPRLAMPGDRERCIVAGASAYLSKPAPLRTLVETINRELPARRDNPNGE